MKRAPMDKNCLSNFPKVIFQPAFLWDMWVNCCLTAQAGGVDPFAVGIQPWLREPRWWWWFGMGKSDSDVFFFSQQKRFFFYDGGLGIFTFWNLGDLLWRDHPTSWLPRKSLRFFFHCFLFSLHITEVEQLYIALHDLGHVQKEEGWRQAAKSCNKPRCVVRFSCGRGCKKTPHGEIYRMGNWHTPRSLRFIAMPFSEVVFLRWLDQISKDFQHEIGVNGRTTYLGIRNIKFVMFSWVETMETT